MALVLTCLLLVLSGAAQTSPKSATPVPEHKLSTLEREVRHELTMLPRYGVFDHLAFRVESNGVATLLGYVRSPGLKADAQKAVVEIPGVREVKNEIEVLPPSPFDDRVRLAVYRQLFGDSGLSRYAHQAVPPIHIIVKGGRVILEGVVATEMDKNLANIKARGVEGVLEVTNNLQVETGH